MRAYKQLLKTVLRNGQSRVSRNGIVKSYFGWKGVYDLMPFPLLTLRKIYWKGVVGELLSFFRAYKNVNDFKKLGVNFWDPWAEPETGDLGRIYGVQWRDFKGVDQFDLIDKEFKRNPYSRRLVVSAWNPAELDKMALPPCHVLFQFYVSEPFISCLLYQRSADVVIGVPYNIASYALLTYIFAKKWQLVPKELIHVIGDAHIYEDHLDVAKTLLKTKSLPRPKLTIRDCVKNKPFEKIVPDDIILRDYRYQLDLKGLKVHV